MGSSFVWLELTGSLLLLSVCCFATTDEDYQLRPLRASEGYLGERDHSIMMCDYLESLFSMDYRGIHYGLDV